MNQKGITPLIVGIIILFLLVLGTGLFYYKNTISPVTTTTTTSSQTGTPINLNGTFGLTIGSPAYGQPCGAGCGVEYHLYSGQLCPPPIGVSIAPCTGGTTYILKFGPNASMPPLVGGPTIINVIGTLNQETIMVSNWTLISYTAPPVASTSAYPLHMFSVFDDSVFFFISSGFFLFE